MFGVLVFVTFVCVSHEQQDAMGIDTLAKYGASAECISCLRPYDTEYRRVYTASVATYWVGWFGLVEQTHIKQGCSFAVFLSLNCFFYTHRPPLTYVRFLKQPNSTRNVAGTNAG